MSAVNGLSVGGIAGGASGSTSATLTVAFNGDFHLPPTLGVRVLAAAHSGSTDITTGRTASTTSDVEAGPVALSEDEN